MCGIVAILSRRGARLDPEALERATDLVAHRGPDGRGTAWLGRDGRPLAAYEPNGAALGLGHRRLAILDLSALGSQPMRRGPLTLTYNGEIYNYVELRRELIGLGHEFSTETDTEVVLAAYAQWDTGCFARLRGMWGLVLVDAERQRLVLSRDRLGIKPLYAALTPDYLVVVSEPKQLSAIPGFRLEPDAQAVRTYLATGFEAFDRSFFRAVDPLPPGTWLTVDLRTGESGSPEPFWFPEQIVASTSDVTFAADMFSERFADAVRVHMRSDVPVGCALSGGLDSSSVAAVAAKLLPGKHLETFSVVFPGHPSDERSFIDLVARHTQANVHLVTPTPVQFLEDFDRFVWTHDEPVGSLSQYAAYVLARLTRAAGVPVTLNGQGGDEVFSAYWQCLLSNLANGFRGGHPLGPLRFLLGALLPSGNAALFGELPGMFRRLRDRRAGGTALELRPGPGAAAGPLGAVLRMTESERRVFDVRQLILPRLLKWDDRNFMAFSVEGRYPFLDHPLIEACLGFTASSLYHKGWVKEPLRRALAADLPLAVVRRKTKVGFETPQPDWLRGPLRSAIETWLAADAPVWQFVEPGAARRLAERVFRADAPRREDHEALFRLWCLERWLRVFSLAPRNAAAA